MQKITNYIDGAKVDVSSDRTSPVFNPATGEQIAQVGLSGVADVRAAIKSAAKAFPHWANTSVIKRARVMFAFNQLLQEHNDLLVATISREHGKVWADAQGELVRGREVVEFVCGIAQMLKGGYLHNVGMNVDVHSFPQPLGVCAGITPFNFPAMVPMWMFPVAIACGNSFVLKPSERDPSTPLLLAELLTQAGLPDGVFNVVNGDKEAVDTLLTSPEIAAVSFVGSTQIAEYVYHTGSKHNKRVQALGGAKNHMVVMPDADLDATVNALVGAAYGSAGERCMAISVVVAVGDVGDKLVTQLKQRASALRIGAGYTKDSNVDYGPLVTAQHLKKVKDYVALGVEEGAQLLLDGRDVTLAEYPHGFYLGPCLFDKVTPEMRIYKEEIFGPVLVVVRVRAFADALELVNAHEYGNGAAIFTSSGGAAHQFSAHCKVGMVGVNVPIPVPVAWYSFGGWKRSIFSPSDIHGPDGVRFYTHNKKITSRWNLPKVDSHNPFHMPTMG